MMTSPRLTPTRYYLWPTRLLGREGPLNCQGAVDSIDDTGEFDERAVANQFDNPAVVRGRDWIELGLAMAPKRGVGSDFVGRHHAGVANHVGRENGRESAIA